MCPEIFLSTQICPICRRPIVALERINWTEITRLIEDCLRFRAIVHEVFAQNLLNTNIPDARVSLVSKCKQQIFISENACSNALPVSLG